jgi:hypothetical protein
LQSNNKPVGIFQHHSGGGKAVESVKSICHSFKFRPARAPMPVLNRSDAEQNNYCTGAMTTAVP